jgi:hypothetical protein
LFDFIIILFLFLFILTVSTRKKKWEKYLLLADLIEPGIILWV